MRGGRAGPAARARSARSTPTSPPCTRPGVDGFVVYSVRDDDPHFLAVLERPLPTVVCDQPTGVEGVDRVGVDDRAGMLALARHLTGLGHRRIGVLCMRLGAGRNDGPAVRRAAGRGHLPGAAGPAGGPARRARRGRRRLGRRAGDTSASTTASTRAQAAAAALLAAHPELTAVVCTSDVLALGALRHAAEQGLAVPEHLTITGFDGVPEAERAGLTTVRQPVLEKGRVAGELLLRARRPQPPAPGDPADRAGARA